MAINAVPDLVWTEQARREIAKGGGDQLVARSDVAVQGDGFILGWVTSSLLSPPWLWFAAAEDFRLRNVMNLVRQQWQLPAELHTAVEQGYPTGHRFARLFGFEPNGDTIEDQGVNYIVYRRA